MMGRKESTKSYTLLQDTTGFYEDAGRDALIMLQITEGNTSNNAYKLVSHFYLLYTHDQRIMLDTRHVLTGAHHGQCCPCGLQLQVDKAKNNNKKTPGEQAKETLSLCLLQCRLLKTFGNKLDPDQARHNVEPDLDSNCLTQMVFPKEYFEKVNFQNSQVKKKHETLPSIQGVMTCFHHTRSAIYYFLEVRY